MKCLTYVNVCKTKTRISQAVSADWAMNYAICKVKSILFPYNIWRVLQQAAAYCCGKEELISLRTALYRRWSRKGSQPYIPQPSKDLFFLPAKHMTHHTAKEHFSVHTAAGQMLGHWVAPRGNDCQWDVVVAEAPSSRPKQTFPFSRIPFSEHGMQQEWDVGGSEPPWLKHSTPGTAASLWLPSCVQLMVYGEPRWARACG